MSTKSKYYVRSHVHIKGHLVHIVIIITHNFIIELNNSKINSSLSLLTNAFTLASLSTSDLTNNAEQFGRMEIFK